MAVYAQAALSVHCNVAASNSNRYVLTNPGEQNILWSPTQTKATAFSMVLEYF